MRKLSVGILIFIAGWSLSRVAYHYSQTESLRPVVSVKPGSVEQVPAGQLATGGAEYIDVLLQSAEYQAAIEHYESLQLQPGETAVVDARTKILSYSHHLIAQSRFSLAEQLLQAFLGAEYRDVEAGMLLAEVYLAKDDYLAAIDKLYEIRGYAYRPVMLQRITHRIRTIVNELDSSLKAGSDQYALLTLYQYLTQVEPQFAPWFIGLAAAQLSVNDGQAASRSLSLVLDDPDVGTQAQAMLSGISTSLAEKQKTKFLGSMKKHEGIPLQRRGNHFIVDATPVRGDNVRLLIDTGASMTIFTPEVLEQSGAGYQDTGKTGMFNTANGPVQAPVYILDSLSVGDWQVNQLEIGVLALTENSGIDGLLGMNFLMHFQFFIDQDAALLRLDVNRR